MGVRVVGGGGGGWQGMDDADAAEQTRKARRNLGAFSNSEL